MALSALQIENRVERLLQSRMRSSGRLNGLDDQELAGIGKALKKAAKKVGKVVKKVAPVALGAGAVYLGAGAIANAVKGSSGGSVGKPGKYEISGKAAGSVPYASMNAGQLSSEAGRLQQLIASGKDVKDAKKKLANVQAYLGSPAGTAMQQAINSGALPASPSPGAQLIDTAGQVANAMISAQGYPGIATDQGMQQIMQEAIASNMPQGYVQSSPKLAPGSQYEELPEVQITADRLKPWIIPGAIAAGLAALLLLSNKRKR